MGEQRLVGQSCSGAWLGEQVPGSPEKGGGEVWREEPTRASWAGQEGGRVAEGIPGGERGCAKVQPARPGELDLDKDPGRCESLEPLSGPLASRDRGRTQHKQGFRGPLYGCSQAQGRLGTMQGKGTSRPHQEVSAAGWWGSLVQALALESMTHPRLWARRRRNRRAFAASSSYGAAGGPGDP